MSTYMCLYNFSLVIVSTISDILVYGPVVNFTGEIQISDINNGFPKQTDTITGFIQASLSKIQGLLKIILQFSRTKSF